ncbi:pore-forming ESAT-6 family protein [Actinoallomurus iriomotensis]|uniref:WXG100 family type VII secretion target n=1 Tax=Actinoallomurus iriomotensis TaxID=478107 RepID=A0A9W6W7H6_9ACTN|nr:pore-forming ESAT-6 family protein [Actinoallomurus iriomotensis]GLY92151.1 hypothetical protein Airi02_100790 [Actinoallomurus iriomotensis]
MGHDRLSWDSGASAETQGNLQTIIGRLEQLIGTHDSDVKAALADFLADGVSDTYSGKEQKWLAAAAQTQQIIDLVKRTMTQNDSTAQQTQSRARAAVDAIGA